MNYRRVLLVIPDGELSELIANWLYELPTLGEYIVIDRVRNEYEAKRHLTAQGGNPYHLIVTNIGIPANRDTPLNVKDQRGLELLKALQTQIPSILIAPSVDSSLFYAARELHRCVPIAEDPNNFHEHLVKYAKEYLYENGNTAPDERVRITFRLDAERSEYSIESLGGLPIQDRNNHIDLDSKLMEGLLESSRIARSITAHPDWEDHLRSIGKQLTQRLFFDTYKLGRTYWPIAGKRKIEICFDVARSVHPVILEALIEPDSYLKKSGNFWMLEAPIYRRLRNDTPTDRYPLFQGPRDRQPAINCLIIEAPTGGLAPQVRTSDGPLQLDDLPSAAREAQSLESYLRLKKKECGLGEILRIHSAGLDGESFRETVHKELTRADISWQLVHYAGHCYYDETLKKGFVFFPGDAFVEAVDLGIFSAWLSRSQFVYLSACQSSEEQVVFELANNHVPSAIGFRWELEDDAAAAYTSLFYEKLFEVHKSLEYAFLGARSGISANKKYAKQRIWAAPMLIMQMSGAGFEAPSHPRAGGVSV
jgi:CHAT domain